MWDELEKHIKRSEPVFVLQERKQGLALWQDVEGWATMSLLLWYISRRTLDVHSSFRIVQREYKIVDTVLE